MIALALLIACAGKGEDSEDAASATLTEVQEDIFSPSCAFSSCHDSAAAEADLDLSAGASHGELVNMESVYWPGHILVVPGDPDASYLLAKVGGPGEIQGDHMPVGTDGISEERIEAIRSWIKDGAQDN
jgi:hypothetical protein